MPLQRTRLLAPADASRLQTLLERCSDYYELHEGWPTPADAGAHELTAVPRGRSPEELLLLALADDEGALDAFAQVLRDHPERGTWWIGLLVVTPAKRGSGIGSKLLRAVIAAAAAEGAVAIQLAVSSENSRGRRFWEAAGFRCVAEEVPIEARSGRASTVRILSRGLR